MPEPFSPSWLFGIAHHQLGRSLRRRRIEDRARRRLGIERVPVDEVSYERIEELADFVPLREAMQRALESASPKLARSGIGSDTSDSPQRSSTTRADGRLGSGAARLA
jgi:hypothetical protein